MQKKALVFASISGCIAVILGALGAHALNNMGLSEKMLHAYETAAHYQLLHSIAIIAIAAIMGQRADAKYFKTIMYLFMSGIILFSGSIYILVSGEILNFNAHWAGPVTPLGGLCLIGAWFVLFLSALKFKEKDIQNNA